MKSSHVCLLLLLLAVSAAAFGDSIQDPKIIIRGVSGSSGIVPMTTCPTLGCAHVGMTWSFEVPESGSGNLYFTNSSGQNWTSMALFEKGVPASAISCAHTLFLSCSTTTLSNGLVEILLTGVSGSSHGVLNGQSFLIGFSCLDKSCWPGGLDFIGHANFSAVPEPASVALVLTGIGAIVSRRKTWKTRFNS